MNLGDGFGVWCATSALSSGVVWLPFGIQFSYCSSLPMNCTFWRSRKRYCIVMSG